MPRKGARKKWVGSLCSSNPKGYSQKEKTLAGAQWGMAQGLGMNPGVAAAIGREW